MHGLNELPGNETKKAGIVVLKEAGNDFLVLGLKFGNTFDLPKGSVEPYESELDAALRETEEEGGITDLDFRWGLQKTKVSDVTLFVATTTQEPVIRRNPQTGEFEHEASRWLTLEEAGAMLHADLRPVVPWIMQITGAV